ncbi:MAG: glutamate--tRNA ligase family protein [Gemmatimonas sp.]
MNITRPIRTAVSYGLGSTLGAQQLRSNWRTRFAPAPTGFLHLGHVVNALHVWGAARAFGGAVLLRIEDHDRTRCRPEFEDALLRDLDWLGFVPDRSATVESPAGEHILRQSDNVARYQALLNELFARGLEYGCICTRKDIAEIVGDQFGEETPYPGTCKHANHTSATARRFRVGEATESFDDIRLGAQSQIPHKQCGDFLLRDRNANFTYQFCASADDWDQEIDLVIRGEDLLASTGRQLSLARALGRKRAPYFLHHQLLLRPDGLKLSKSLGDNGVRELREAGFSREQVLGRAAFLCGLIKHEAALDIGEISLLFS